ncbi:MAG: iron-sulfur cluster repair di-iron protein, partial [Balneolaceae bacterium]|nr:iron-sulfur cluster repair di-iron protein [Balneolaceae bacterium]
AAGVFREFGIDFCCGGGKRLADVCQIKGIQLQSVTNKLEPLLNIPQNSVHNYNDWTPAFLIDFIINTHHAFVRKKTDEISAHALKVARVHGERHPENVKIFRKFLDLGNEMTEHLEAEENTVFPLIKRIEQNVKNEKSTSKENLKMLRNELDKMVDDHEDAGNVMEEIRTLSNDYTPPQDACTTYRILYQNLEGFEQDLHKHVHLENNILFKKAENLIRSLS